MRKGIRGILYYASLIAALAFLPAPAAGQRGKCNMCTYAPCAGEFGYVCPIGQVSTFCTRSNLDGNGCYQSCTNNYFCNFAAATEQGCNPQPASALSVHLMQQETDKQQKKLTDDETQAQLLKIGASAPQIELQFGDPVTFISSLHTTDDMLASAKVLNISKMTVTAIRIGWTVKTPNRPDEARIGEWILIPGGLDPDATASVPAQRLDVAPLRTPGTLVKFFVGQVKFQSGSIWERPLEKKPTSDQNRSFLIPPASPVRTVSAKG